MMTKCLNIVDLPDDLVVEIFSRVPAVSLERLQSSSKALYALIKDERFANMHSTNAPKQSLIIMLIASRVYLLSVDHHKIHNNKVKPTSHFSLKDPLSNFQKEVDIRNIFHCDGLLLCTTKDYRLVVWNPCSREIKWIQLRNSYKIYDVYALGKSSGNKYKILRIDQVFNYSIGRGFSHESEIYDFTSNSWSLVSTTSDWFIPRCWNRGMSVNGNTYWLAYNKDFSNVEFLLSFDFSTERFASVSLPGDHSSYRLIALSVTIEDQKLCLLATQGLGLGLQQLQDIDLWIANKIESTGAVSWIKFLSVGTLQKKSTLIAYCYNTNYKFAMV